MNNTDNMQYTSEEPIFTVTIPISEYRQLIEENVRNKLDIKQLGHMLDDAESSVKNSKAAEEFARDQYDRLEDKYFNLEIWLESDGRKNGILFEEWLKKQKEQKYTDEAVEPRIQ